MNNLTGTQTEQNLRFAFSGESEARNKYTFFAKVAKQEGYEQIAAIFEETALNEKAHAKLWFEALSGIGSTLENLKKRRLRRKLRMGRNVCRLCPYGSAGGLS